MFKASTRRSVLAFASAVLVLCGMPAARAQDNGVDTSIRPGDDFFAYANGDWLKATEIPAGRQRFGAFNEIGERTRQRMQQLLADARHAPRGSSARQVADYHAACLDEAAIEAGGIGPLKPELDRIERVRDQTTLTRVLGQGLRADVDPMNFGVYDSAHVLGLAVQASNQGGTGHVAFLVQGGLSLPDREVYLGSTAQQQARLAELEQTIARVLAASGVPQAQQRAPAVLALETALARSHATSETSAQDRNAEQVWTREDFARQAPGMDWAAFFAAAGLARQPSFVAWQPGALQGLAKLVGTQPLQAWKDYLRFHTLLRHADVLPRAYAEPLQALRPAGADRARRAMEATQSAFSDALGRLYTQSHFPPEHKARLQTMATTVIAAFGQRLETVSWLTPASRARAQAKLKGVYFGLGYPEQWPVDARVAISPTEALGNRLRVAERDYRQALARLGRPVQQSTWVVPAQWPGAMLAFNLNAYNFTAALLQPPKFDPAASDAANYGAIGAIIGHEVSHFIDTLGADYELNGRLQRWWTAEDLAGYQAATAPLVNQYESYAALPDLHVNGKLTLTENLADLGGLAAAFDAWRQTPAARAATAEQLRRMDREFFIGFARAWRSKATEAGLRALVASDSHAPDNFRVATVRNIDAWYEAFDVQPGQRLYLEPSARVRVW